MRFQFDIALTEEDYLAFNYFHHIESADGRKQVQIRRVLFLFFMAIMVALVIIIRGWTVYTTIYTVLMTLFAFVYFLCFNKSAKRSLKAQIEKLSKSGNLPFDPISKMEFYEDHLVDISAKMRIELSYEGIKRMCVVANRYIFLYDGIASAYILPLSQIKEQVNPDDFLRFLLLKSKTIENY
ncbi:MAG: hypothetical protein IJ388_00830 [Oscillospiraceae bacterium]|nr:hypothetical protein [Oscillospiraceae bacterium]